MAITMAKSDFLDEAPPLVYSPERPLKCFDLHNQCSSRFNLSLECCGNQPAIDKAPQKPDERRLIEDDPTSQGRSAPGPRRTFPGRAFVIAPFSITGTPFT